MSAAEKQERVKETARRQVEIWKSLAGRWISDLTPEEEIRQINSASTSGRDVKF